MVRSGNDVTKEMFEHRFGGDGSIIVETLNADNNELNGKGRVFAHTTIQPGSSIGYHEHHGESEIYYILSGVGEFNDNGNKIPVSAGDVTYTFSGMGHAIRNTGDTPLEVMALILFA